MVMDIAVPMPGTAPNMNESRNVWSMIRKKSCQVISIPVYDLMIIIIEAADTMAVPPLLNIDRKAITGAPTLRLAPMFSKELLIRVVEPK